MVTKQILCHIDITKTYVNGTPVDFDWSDPVSELTLGGNTNIAHHQIYKSKYLAALRDADDGELSISIPDHCIKQVLYLAGCTFIEEGMLTLLFFL